MKSFTIIADPDMLHCLKETAFDYGESIVIEELESYEDENTLVQIEYGNIKDLFNFAYQSGSMEIYGD